MKKIITYILLAGSMLSASTTSIAQDSLSVEQCRQLALEYNSQLKQAHYQQQEAKAQQDVARTAYYPSVAAEVTIMHRPESIEMSMPGGFLPTADSQADAEAGNFSGMSDVYSPGMNIALDNMTLITGGLSLTQPLYAGGKIRYSNKMADLGVEMTDYAYQMKYGEVVEQTDKAFWQLAMIEANIELAESYIDMLTELEEQMNKMHDLGLAPASEKLRVSVQKNEAELQLLQANNGLKLAKMHLNQLTGRPLNANVDIWYSKLDANLFDMSNGSELALNNRSELKLLSTQVTLAEYDKKIARADYLPTVGVSAQYSTNYINELYEETEFSPMISGQISIPLFAWGQGAKKQKAADFVIRQRQEELSRTSELISLEVMQVQIQISEAYEALLIAEQNIAEAEESLAETKASFEAGLNTTTDLLNAQASWQRASVQRVNAIAQFKVLETSWARVTGSLQSTEE